MNRLPIVVFLFAMVCSCLAQMPVAKKIELAKDDHDKPGKVVKGFAPGDGPIHCLIHLDPLKSPWIFTGTLIAVKAADVQLFKVATVNLSARAGSNLVDFKFSLPRPWPAGSYKVEIKANGKPFREIAFAVK